MQKLLTVDDASFRLFLKRYFCIGEANEAKLSLWLKPTGVNQWSVMNYPLFCVNYAGSNYLANHWLKLTLLFHLLHFFCLNHQFGSTLVLNSPFCCTIVWKTTFQWGLTQLNYWVNLTVWSVICGVFSLRKQNKTTTLHIKRFLPSRTIYSDLF